MDAGTKGSPGHTVLVGQLNAVWKARLKNSRALFTERLLQSQRQCIPNLRTCTAHAQCKRTHLKNRRALFTERAWILQSWLLKPITGHAQRDLQLVPTCPCMLHLAPSAIATQPPSPARPAGPSLNTVTLSHQRTSSCHTIPATALVVRMRM